MNMFNGSAPIELLNKIWIKKNFPNSCPGQVDRESGFTEMFGHFLDQPGQSLILSFYHTQLPNCSSSWFKIQTFPSISLISLKLHPQTAQPELETTFEEITSPLQIPAILFKKPTSFVTGISFSLHWHPVIFPKELPSVSSQRILSTLYFMDFSHIHLTWFCFNPLRCVCFSWHIKNNFLLTVSFYIPSSLQNTCPSHAFQKFPPPLSTMFDSL